MPVILHKDIGPALCHAPRVDGISIKLIDSDIAGEAQLASMDMDNVTANRPLYYDGQRLHSFNSIAPNTLMVSSPTRNLESSDVTASDLLVLEGISAYDTTREDLASIANVGGVIEADGDSLFVLPGKSIDIHGILKLSGSPITATAAELNKLDGCAATTEEINRLSGAIPGKIIPNKVLLAGQGNTLDEGEHSADNLYNLRLEGTLYADRVISADIQNIGGALNASALGGHPSSYYLNADNKNAGVLPVGRGGLGATAWADRQLPIFNNISSNFEPFNVLTAEGNFIVEGDIEVTGDILEPLLMGNFKGREMIANMEILPAETWANSLGDTGLQMLPYADLQVDQYNTGMNPISAVTLPVTGYYSVKTTVQITCTALDSGLIDNFLLGNKNMNLRHYQRLPHGYVPYHILTKTQRGLVIDTSSIVGQTISMMASFVFVCAEEGMRFFPSFSTYLSSTFASFGAALDYNFSIRYIGALHE